MADRWAQLGNALSTMVLELGKSSQEKKQQSQNEAFLNEISSLLGTSSSGQQSQGLSVKPSGEVEGEEDLLLKTPEVDINEVFGPTPDGMPDLSQPVSEDEANQFMQAYDTGGAISGVLNELQTEDAAAGQQLPAFISQQLGMESSSDDKYGKAQTYVDLLNLANKYNVSDTQVIDNIMKYMYPKQQKKTGTDWAAKYEYDKAMKGPGGLQWNLEQMKSENINKRQQAAHLRKMSGMERKYHLMGEHQQEKADDAMDALNLRRNMKIYGQMDASIQQTMAGLQSGEISKAEAEKNIKTVHDYYEKQQEKLWEEISSEEAYLLPKAVRELKLGQLEDILESKDKAIDAMRALNVKSPQLDTERRKLENMKAKFAKDARTKKGMERKKALFYLQKVNEQLQQLK